MWWSSGIRDWALGRALRNVRVEVDFDHRRFTNGGLGGRSLFRLGR